MKIDDTLKKFVEIAHGFMGVYKHVWKFMEIYKEFMEVNRSLYKPSR